MLRCRQRRDLGVEIGQAVVDVDAQFVEQLLVLGERVLVEDLHRVPEDDGVRHLHHRRLDVQGEHHTRLIGILHLSLVEVAQGLLAHEHAVDDVALVQRDLRLEHDRLAALGHQFQLHVACAVQRHRLLAVVEVALRMCATCVREAIDHSPMLCGCLRAYSLTALGARRSELPSRRTGFTALPRHLP